jgi:hypothetical protein
MATPYVLDYDLILLAPAIAWLAAEGGRSGFLAWEKLVLLVVFLLPLVSRSIGVLGIPIAPPLLLVFLGMIVRRTCVQSGFRFAKLAPRPGGQSL